MSYKTYFGIEHLDRLEHATLIAFDTETTQLQPKNGGLRLLQLGSDTSKTIVVIDFFDLEESDFPRLERFFNNGPRHWWAHNAVFDLGWLQAHNLYPKGHVFCTMLASKLHNNGKAQTKHRLDVLAKRYLGKTLSKEQQASDWSADQLSQEQLTYAAKDVEVLLELVPRINHFLRKHDLFDAFHLECGALPAMAQMWRTGLPWNRDALEQLRKDYVYEIEQLGKEFLLELDEALPEGHKLPRESSERLEYLKDEIKRMDMDPAYIAECKAEIEELETQPAVFNLRAKETGSKRLGTKKLAGFNINSPKQLIEKFTLVLGEPPKDEKTDKPSASRSALQSYAADHHVVQTYLAWKKAEKRRQMVESIQDKLAPDGFVRASYLQLGAASGRMSCINPNNQQIPKDEVFRSCVEAPEDWVLVDADFSQMELRLAAAVAEDETMTKALLQGGDLHEFTAEAMGYPTPISKEHRQIAKSANFGLLYGSGPKGLRNYAVGYGLNLTIKEATDIRDKWLKTYSGISKWQKANASAADETAHKSWTDIRIPLSFMRRQLSRDFNRLTIRCNTPIQGAGAAVLKCALGRLWPLLFEAGEDEVKLAACVHDEILLLVKEPHGEKWAQILKEVMESAEALWLGDIPPLAEPCIGKRWSEIH